ncbi:hypothetical protein N9446_00905 [bacterium]|jgi:hypothetical protein|nr:hypothetical protein [bacterium]
MSAKSNYLEAKILDHTLKNTAFTQPTTLALALFVTGSDTDAVVEGHAEANSATWLGYEVATATGYARATITFDPAQTSVGTDEGSGAEDDITSAVGPAVAGGIEFDNDGTGDFGTVTWFGIYDNATHNAGNLLYFGKLTASKAIANGDTLRFAQDAITIKEA